MAVSEAVELLDECFGHRRAHGAGLDAVDPHVSAGEFFVEHAGGGGEPAFAGGIQGKAFSSVVGRLRTEPDHVCAVDQDFFTIKMTGDQQRGFQIDQERSS